jgi:hypothetical protein
VIWDGVISKAWCLPLAAILLPLGVRAQEATSGVAVPITISGDARYSRSTDDGGAGAAGFRFVLSPSLRLGTHWFAYSVLNAQSSRYLPYSTGFDTGRAVGFSVMQAYVGYKADFKSASLLIKAGRLASAFGLYPLEYDDAKSPLIDPPPLYITNLLLRPDQIPCNIADVIWQSYDEGVQFHCGGSGAERYGMVPVTLYGIPGVEAQMSWNRLDARLQITNSSPANPQSLVSRSQFAQWTAGGGYSLHGGVHLGVSGFRGPYLDRLLGPLLPAGERLGGFSASGIGVDGQWSGGPWSLEGEWQRFRFGVPGFLASPSQQGAYFQAKRIISPRVFAAIRSSVQRPGGATDRYGQTASQIDARQEIEEFVVGYRINRLQLLKTGVNYGNRNGWWLDNWYYPAEHRFGLEFQLVTVLSGLSKGFR